MSSRQIMTHMNEEVLNGKHVSADEMQEFLDRNNMTLTEGIEIEGTNWGKQIILKIGDRRYMPLYADKLTHEMLGKKSVQDAIAGVCKSVIQG